MGFLKDFLFGSDTTKDAFKLNQANIMAGVQALQAAGEEGLPLLREISPFLAAAFTKAEQPLTQGFAQARQAANMGRGTGQAQAQEAFQMQAAQANVGNQYNTSLRQQQHAQLAQMLQKGVMYSEAATGQRLGDLFMKEGLAKTDLRRTGALAQADAKAAVPQYMRDLAEAEAAMRGGITYQGSTTSGLISQVLSAWAGGGFK